MRVFGDSNYLIALFNIKDGLHEKALTISDKLTNENTTLVVSSFIFLETVTVLSQKVNREVARRVGNELLLRGQVEILHVTEVLQDKSWEIFQEINRKNVSFVDCSILAIMEQEDIPLLLTFDREDFKPLQKAYKFEIYSK